MPARRPSINQEENATEMNIRLRVLSTLGAMAIVASACTTGGTPAPASQPAASQAAPASQPAGSPTGSAAAASAAPLTGSLAIWEAYGASGTSEKDAFDNWIINKKYNPAMLTEAICKLEGFVYAPSETDYWQHGRATERDFIYVTTQTLSREQLAKLSEEVGEQRSLLVMCAAFRARKLDEFPNLTIKKIPKTVLSRCEWGHDDYSLQVENLPKAPPQQGQQDL